MCNNTERTWQGKSGLAEYEPELNLAYAIVKLAIEDYKEALEEEMNVWKIHERNAAKRSTKELERFFLSDWGQLLTDNHGEDIIRIIRKQVLGD